MTHDADVETVRRKVLAFGQDGQKDGQSQPRPDLPDPRPRRPNPARLRV